MGKGFSKSNCWKRSGGDVRRREDKNCELFCFSPCWFAKMGERLDSAQAILLGFESLVNHRDGAFDLQSHRIILMLVTLLQPQRRMLPSWWECHPYGLSAMTARPSGHIVEILGTPCFV